MLFLANASTVVQILIHLASIGYLAGIFFWGRSNRGDDSKVTFWNKSTPTTKPSDALSRGFQLGMGVYKILFIPVIIASNWLPYAEIDRGFNNNAETQKSIIKQLDLVYELGEPIYFNPLSTTTTDSTTTIQLRASGKYEQGLIFLTMDFNDSILNMTFQKE